MSYEDGVNDEFGELVDRMSDPSMATTVEIAETTDTASIVEVTVPIATIDRPELALFTTIVDYLGRGQRRAVLGMQVTYEIRSHAQPHLIGTLFLGDPMGD